MRPIAIQIGAGNIGRGFLGQVFHESGFEAHFIDADAALVEQINAAGRYLIEIAADPPVPNIEVTGVHAHLPGEETTLANLFARAKIAAVSAGPAARPAIAAMLGSALDTRIRSGADPLNVLVCENPPGEAASLRAMVRQNLAEELRGVLETRVGFVDTVIGRMVPVREEDAADPLLVRVEPYCELPVDAEAVCGALPPIAHVHSESPFAFWIDRKLFMHNAAHAAAAYAGYLYGHTYVYEAMDDPRVLEIVEGVLQETGAALAKHYNESEEALSEHAADLIRRFTNRALRDTVERVARDPLRKLAPQERFMRAAACCLQAGVEPRALAFAAAAVMRYDPPSDPEAQTLQNRLGAEGVDAVLQDVCGLDAANPFAAFIKQSPPLTALGSTRHA